MTATRRVGIIIPITQRHCDDQWKSQSQAKEQAFGKWSWLPRQLHQPHTRTRMGGRSKIPQGILGREDPEMVFTHDR